MNPAGAAGGFALAAYLLWLGAGCADFACHRRADLPHTSGLAESLLHGLQLALIGSGVAVFLLFEVAPATLTALAALVVAHALAGYADTRVAFAARRIRPLEQHVHSVLDMGPWIALAWIAIAHWPAWRDAGWAWPPLRDPVPVAAWIAALAPALILCVVPAALELRAALAARKDAPHAA